MDFYSKENKISDEVKKRSYSEEGTTLVKMLCENVIRGNFFNKMK